MYGLYLAGYHGYQVFACAPQCHESYAHFWTMPTRFVA